MITEKDLQEAIAECEGNRNPNANTCIKLAAFYTIRNELFGSPPPDIGGYSHDAAPPSPEGKIIYDSGTEFSDIINGGDISSLLPVMDELMESVRLMIPRLYASVIERLRDIYGRM